MPSSCLFQHHFRKIVACSSLFQPRPHFEGNFSKIILIQLNDDDEEDDAEDDEEDDADDDDDDDDDEDDDDDDDDDDGDGASAAAAAAFFPTYQREPSGLQSTVMLSYYNVQLKSPKPGRSTI